MAFATECQPLNEEAYAEVAERHNESDLEAEEVASSIVQARPWATRGRALTVGVLVAGALCGTYVGLSGLKGSPEVEEYVPFSHPAFVNLVTVPVTVPATRAAPVALAPGTEPAAKATMPVADTGSAAATAKRRLCSKKLVHDVCSQFYNEADSAGLSAQYKAAHPLNHRKYVHAKEIAVALTVTRASVVNLLQHLQITDAEQSQPDTYSFTCQELCEKLVGSFPANTVPATSDVGCYNKGGKAVCDVSTSPQDIGKLTLNGISTAEKKKGFGESSRMKAETGEAATDVNEENIRQALKADGTSTPEQLALLHSLEHQTMDFRTLRLILANLFRIYPTTSDAAEVEVPKGPTLVVGTAPAPALPKSAPSPQPSAPGGYQYVVRKGERSPVVPAGAMPARRLADAAWESMAQKSGLKAKAAVTLTLQKMEGRKVQNVVERWFGNNLDKPTRSNLKRVLTGVQSLLNNVEYVYPGEACSPNMYAYVVPQGAKAKDAQGQYIIYLCEKYINAAPDLQIETLVHESTHHQTMSTDDGKWGKEVMYGREINKKVAAACAAKDESACSKALTNADTFEYFVADAISPGGVAKTAPGPADGITAEGGSAPLFQIR